MGNSCHSLDLSGKGTNRHHPKKTLVKFFITFYSAGGDEPSEFFGFIEDKNHQPNSTLIAFGRILVKKRSDYKVGLQRRRQGA